jgi:hypothetical protein
MRSMWSAGAVSGGWRGAVLSLELAWRLAAAWFSDDRGAPEWRRPTVDEVERLFASLGLTDSFWTLR